MTITLLHYTQTERVRLRDREQWNVDSSSLHVNVYGLLSWGYLKTVYQLECILQETCKIYDLYKIHRYRIVCLIV